MFVLLLIARARAKAITKAKELKNVLHYELPFALQS
jgi:hypothetical protein